MNRRSLVLGLGSLLFSPSIVRASSLMPISPFDPDWIVNHQDPIFGELVVRIPGARNLKQFSGRIQPGQVFWRRGKELVDLCVWPNTQLDVTPGLLSVQHPQRIVEPDLYGLSGYSKFNMYASIPSTKIGFWRKSM